MYCECGNPVENRETGKCSSCAHAERRAARVKPQSDSKPMNKMSPKTADVNRRYLNRLKSWKKGKKCAGTFPHDCNGLITCHHMVGRGNHFYDEYATDHEIPLTLDERFWLPLCINAHEYVTVNSKWACENGYSFLRLTDPVFIKSK